ncbi:MAG TPA: DUF4382 domain-containing protein [Steroidobacteraceae bacterium]
MAKRGKATVAIAALAIPLCFGGLAGCTAQATVNVAGSAPAAASHVWITVEQIWFSTAPDTLPEATGGWIQVTLPNTITLDLANLTPATLTQLATSLGIASGTYLQVHLVLADAADALLTSAQNDGLTYNSQITVTNFDGGTGTGPLELPEPEGGLTIATNFRVVGTSTLFQNFTSNSSSNSSATSTASSSSSSAGNVILGMTIDAARDVVSYAYGTNIGYILTPITTVHDVSSAGGISGTLDTTALAAGTTVAVSAELPDSSQTHHAVVQRLVVNGNAGGSFTLYPLPAPSGSTTNYDLVISGAGAQTVLIRGVPVTPGTAASAATVAQSTPIVLAPASIVYADINGQLATPLPGGARVDFYETVPANGELPYWIDGTAVDPVTRTLPADNFALSSGPLVVGAYNSGNAITFTTENPLERAGGYVVGSSGLYRADTLNSVASAITGSLAAPTVVAAPVPTLPTGAFSGTLTLSVSTTSRDEFDSGFVTVSSGNRLVETASIASILPGGGGSITISNLPSGTALVSGNGVPYQVAVRAWNSGNPAGTITRVAGANSLSFGNGAAGSIAIPLP